VNRGLADVMTAVLALGILTCWAPGYWPVALAQVGAFVMLGWVLLTRQPIGAGWAAVTLAGTVAWGLGQSAGGGTVYRFETGKAVLYWAANASMFIAARAACTAALTRSRFLRGLLWFGSLVSLLAVVQYFTSQGRVFWVFATGGNPISANLRIAVGGCETAQQERLRSRPSEP
jgi:hypothetical protein